MFAWPRVLSPPAAFAMWPAPAASNASATALPRLPAAPVMNTTLPVKSIMSSLACRVEKIGRRELVGQDPRVGGPAPLDLDLRQQPSGVDTERPQPRFQEF